MNSRPDLNSDALGKPPPKRESKTRNWIIVSAALILVPAALLMGYAKIAEHIFRSVTFSTGSDFVTAMNPVDVDLIQESDGATVRLRIPKAFLTDKRNWSGGKQDRVEIQAVLPDMRPRSIAQKEQQDFSKSSVDVFEQGVFIEVANGIYVGSLTDSLFRTGGFTTRRPDQFGLKRYQHTDCRGAFDLKNAQIINTQECVVYGWDEIFISRETNDGVYFRCARPEMVSKGTCYASTTFRRRPLQYAFRRSKLPEWQRIDTEVKKLLDSFVINEQPSRSRIDR